MAMTAFELFGVLKLDKKDFDTGLKDAEKSSSSFGSKLGHGLSSALGVGIKAIGAATAAVTGFGATAVAVGSSFDAAMGGIAATAGKSVDELSAELGEVDTAYGHFSGTLRDFALYMGQNTAYSATEAASALNFMALAGYNTQQSMEMLPSVLSMAAAGSMDLAKASDMITDTQSALGLNFKRTGQMVNEFAKAASTGNTSVEQLGEAMLRVGGLGAELNGGFITLADGTQAEVDNVQELEIAFTAMANAGIKGSEAGTHMRNMLLKLASPTDDGAAAFEALGVSIFDNEGKMRSLGAIMEDLGTGLNSLTQADKLQAISDIFNTRDTAAAEALMNAMGQDWDRIGEAILQADGAADEMSKTKLDNLTGDMTLFKSALETAQITINDQLSPTLRQFVQLGTTGLQEVTNAFNEGGLEGAMGAFGSVLSDGLKMVTDLLPEAINAGTQLLGALGQGLMDNADVLLDAAIEVVNNIMQSMLEATNGEGKDSFILGFFKTLSDALINNAPQLMSTGFQILQNLIMGITTSLSEIIPTAIEMILTLVTGLLDNVDLLIDSAIALVTGLAEGLINALPVLLEKAPVIIEKLVEVLIINLPKLLITAGEIVGKLVVGIIQNLPRMLEAGISIITSLQTGMARLYVKLLDAGKQAVLKVWEGIKSIDPVKWGHDMIDSFIRGIKDRIAKVAEVAQEVAGTIKSFLGFSEPEMGPLSNFHTYAPDMMALFAQGIRDNKNMLLDTVADAFDFEKVISDATVSSNVNMGYNSNSRIIALLEQIAAGGRVEVVLQEDADAMFRVMQRKSRTNKQITGQESFA